MNVKRTMFWPLAVVAAATVAGARAEWTATRLAVVEEFQTPECVVVDPSTGKAYVSNVVIDSGGKSGPWTADNAGFVSVLKPGGQLDVLRWKENTPQGPLSGPKGMCILGGRLYVADITGMVRFALTGDESARAHRVSGAERLNDMAAGDQAVYVSDTGAGQVHRFARGEHGLIKAPETVNGITLSEGKMFAVSWGLHEIYELDPSGQAEPQPFGLASHFTSLDGIEVLEDGTFIVSDFQGNKVCTISPDRRTVRTLIETDTPADIGLDRERSLLYVPCFMHDRVEVYKLEDK
jgi:DNA-binding beta-propeller fold protein YncE